MAPIAPDIRRRIVHAPAESNIRKWKLAKSTRVRPFSGRRLSQFFSFRLDPPSNYSLETSFTILTVNRVKAKKALRMYTQSFNQNAATSSVPGYLVYPIMI